MNRSYPSNFECFIHQIVKEIAYHEENIFEKKITAEIETAQKLTDNMS
jgi:hypothetical protein